MGHGCQVSANMKQTYKGHEKGRHNRNNPDNALDKKIKSIQHTKTEKSLTKINRCMERGTDILSLQTASSDIITVIKFHFDNIYV